MRLHRQIVTAAMAAGSLFTLMIYWMVAVTNDLPHPTLAGVCASGAIVLLFWWLVGSFVAHYLQQQVDRTVSALRTRMEEGLRLRRTLDEQRSRIEQFAHVQSPLIAALEEDAQRLAGQYDRLLATHTPQELLDQWLQLADECSEALRVLNQQAVDGQAKTSLLHHDLDALDGLRAPVDLQLEALNRLAQQSQLLALNARIEAARCYDRTQGIGLLTEEIRQLADAAASMAGTIESQLQQLVVQAQLATQHTGPMQAHWQAMTAQADDARALQDEQWDLMEQLSQHQHEGMQSPRNSLIRSQIEQATAALRESGANLHRALDALLQTTPATV